MKRLRHSPASIRPPRRTRRGASLMLTAGALVLALGFAVMVVDVGYVAVHRAHLQSAADAAALAAGQMLDGTEESEDAALQAAIDVAERNGVAITAQEVEFGKGSWNRSSNRLEVDWGRQPVNIVRVSTKRREVPTFFARFFGSESFDMRASSSSGWFASERPRDFMLALDYSASMGYDFDNPIQDTSKPNYTALRRTFGGSIGAIYDYRWTGGYESYYPRLNTAPIDALHSALGEFVDQLRQEEANRAATENVGVPDRAGLITFARRPNLLRGLQTDLDEIESLARNQDVDDGRSSTTSGTNIGGAIEEAVQSLKNDRREKAIPTIVLLSDGQPNVDADGAAYAEGNGYRRLSYPDGRGYYEHRNSHARLPDGRWLIRGHTYRHNRFNYPYGNGIVYDYLPFRSYSYVSNRWHRPREYALDAADQAAEAGIRIVTISLGPEADRDLMEQIAQKTHGEHYVVESATDVAALADAFRRVAEEGPKTPKLIQ